MVLSIILSDYIPKLGYTQLILHKFKILEPFQKLEYVTDKNNEKRSLKWAYPKICYHKLSVVMDH